MGAKKRGMCATVWMPGGCAGQKWESYTMPNECINIILKRINNKMKKYKNDEKKE